MKSQTQNKWRIAKATATWPLSNIVKRWNLDSPKEETAQDDDQDILIRGWALKADDVSEDLHVVVQGEKKTLSYTFDVEREDVIRAFLEQDPAGHKQLTCGFALKVPAANFHEGLLLGFETNWLIHSAVTIRLEK